MTLKHQGGDGSTQGQHSGVASARDGGEGGVRTSHRESTESRMEAEAV